MDTHTLIRLVVGLGMLALEFDRAERLLEKILDRVEETRERTTTTASTPPAATPAPRNFFQRIFGMHPRQAPAPPPPPPNRRRGTPPR